MKLRVSPLFAAIPLFLLSCATTGKGPKGLRKDQVRLGYSDSTEQLYRQSGIDFIASGSTPKPWTLSLDFDKAFLFQHSQGTDKARPVEPSPIMDAPGETYFCGAARTPFDITLMGESCRTAEGQTLPYTVSINREGLTYSGCGRFITDNRLHDIWALERLDDEPQFALNYPQGLPRLELNLYRQRMYGFNGCHDVESAFELRGNWMRFGQIYPETKPCPTDLIGRILDEWVSRRMAEWALKDGKLVLYLMNDRRLTFRKVD